MKNGCKQPALGKASRIKKICDINVSKWYNIYGVDRKMEQNIYFDVAAVILCFIIFISFIFRKYVIGRDNKIFLSIAVLVMLTGVFDIITLLYGSVLPADKHSVFYQLLFNYLFFLTRNAVVPIYIVYLAFVIGVWHKFRESAILKILLIVPFCIDIVLLIINAFSPILFGINENYEYYRGKYIFLLYVVAFFYMLFGIFVVIISHKVINMQKGIILVSFLPVGGLSVLVQLFSPEWRVEIFAMAAMTFVLALAIQNAEEDIDQITNTQSYAAFLNEIDKAFKVDRPISIVFIKIRNHKTIRKNLGMDDYSNVLKKISEEMRQICKDIKLGADIYFIDRGTYAVIAPNHKTDKLLSFAIETNEYLKRTIMLSDLAIKIDARMTLVEVPKDINKEEMLINFAHTFRHSLPDSDSVIILAEYLENNQYKIATNIDEIVTKAILERNFYMYYQPIYCVKSRKFASAEALIRLIDEEYGFVSPGVFIPAAEESGAIHKIGDFVMDDVCRFIGENDLDKYGVDYIEVNLSVAQCIEPNLASKIVKIMKKNKVNSDCINIEITETAVDYAPDIMDANINELRSHGISFSLDDYGTGYSNISRVAELPVDIIKIDKSIADEIDNPTMLKFIEHTVAMFKDIDKEILVEGIEDEKTLNKFIELGCDYIQGYYFSKPLPEKEYLEFVKEKNR